MSRDELPLITFGRPKKEKKPAPNSAWIDHVKKYSQEKNIRYGVALVDPECSNSYKAKKAPVKGGGDA
jgi:predicted membrane-bound spermidine synthase